MLSKRKIWIGLGMATTLTVGHAAEPAATAANKPPAPAAQSASQNDFPGGTFSDALRKVLAGEGGEGGIGLEYKSGTVTVPALKGAQISEALTGNTLARSSAFALHFRSGGKFSGWETKWVPVAAADCAKAGSDENYEKGDDGSCEHRVTVQVPQGTWRIAGNLLCTQPALERAAGGNECTSAFLILDNLVLFDRSGKMMGKPNELLKGPRLETQR